MKIIFGTGNQAKLDAMKRRLEPLGVELMGLRDIDMAIPDIIENGNTPLENAAKKAGAYYTAFHMPVFSCDSGLYIDNVSDSEQPGVHVRTINGKYLTDDEMLEHYTKLAARHGNPVARYRNAICLYVSDRKIYSAMDKDMESKPFILTSIPHSKIRKEGFPLDSISIDIKTGEYFYDLSQEELNSFQVEDGFCRFFTEVMETEEAFRKEKEK